jgi:Ubiquitin C-terminal hydrolase
MDLLILPNVLIFHLSRFEIEDEYQMKLETLIKFPVEELDMRPFAAIPQKEPPIYRLYGIAVLFLIFSLTS